MAEPSYTIILNSYFQISYIIIRVSDERLSPCMKLYRSLDAMVVQELVMNKNMVSVPLVVVARLGADVPTHVLDAVSIIYGEKGCLKDDGSGSRTNSLPETKTKSRRNTL